MDTEFAIPHREWDRPGRGGRSVMGRPSRFQGAARRYATGLRPALDPRASAAREAGFWGQAGGLPSACHGHPAPDSAIPEALLRNSLRRLCWGAR